MIKAKNLDSVNENYLRMLASKVNEGDIGKIVTKVDEILNIFKSDGPLKKFIEDAKLLIELVNDYWNKKYTVIPWWAISAVVAALLYVLSPIDLIPDYIPAVGLSDDALVMTICLAMIEQELNRYKDWKIKSTV